MQPCAGRIFKGITTPHGVLPGGNDDTGRAAGLNLALRICFLLACAACYVVQTVYFTHMLQLNSYRPERYGNGAVELRAAFLYRSSAAIGSGSAAVCAAGAHRVRRGNDRTGGDGVPLPAEKGQKPLVITARVKRLWVTAAVLLAALLTGLHFAGISLLGAVLTVLTASLAWIWVGVANLLNLPVEKGIARHYVNDARRILRAMPGLIVIGITGSYGKNQRQKFPVHAAVLEIQCPDDPGKPQYHDGRGADYPGAAAPVSRDFYRRDGAKNPGDIREICELVRPKYGILTAIGEQHLETFKTIDNIIRTKFELADAIPC